MAFWEGQELPLAHCLTPQMQDIQRWFQPSPHSFPEAMLWSCFEESPRFEERLTRKCITAKPTWTDAEHCRLLSFRGKRYRVCHWDHSGPSQKNTLFGHLCRKLIFHFSLQKWKTKHICTLLPKCLKCEPQMQWKPLASREIWVDGSVNNCLEQMVRTELIY